MNGAQAASKNRAIWRGVLWLATAASLLWGGVFTLRALSDERVLRTIALAETQGAPTDEAQALALAGWIDRKVPRLTIGDLDRPFLRMGPTEIIEKGGMCGELSRLLINLLREVKIPAHRVYLFDQGRFTDAVDTFNVNVEAWIDGRWVVFDTYYYEHFRLADGRLATTADLVRDRDLLKQSKTPLKATSYLHVSRINWSRPRWIGPMLFRLVSLALGERARDLALPAIFEQPNMLLGLAGLCVAVLGMLLILLGRNDRAEQRTT